MFARRPLLDYLNGFRIRQESCEDIRRQCTVLMVLAHPMGKRWSRLYIADMPVAYEHMHDPTHVRRCREALLEVLARAMKPVVKSIERNRRKSCVTVKTNQPIPASDSRLASSGTVVRVW